MQRIESGSAAFDAKLEALIRELRSGGLTSADSAGDLDVPAIVADIIQRVRAGGDVAAAELAARLDNAKLDANSLLVPPERIEAARGDASDDFLMLVRKAAANIREYQEHIIHRAPPPLERGGRRLGVRYTPMDRVGVYVPGGKAFYPSSVLMTIVPAQVAGVSEVVVATPATGGSIAPAVLALLGELGVQEVVALGGAVAVAALAYGTERIRPVQKIVGPGNAFVAEAKRQVFGRVGIDSIAGPSEVVIVADETATPRWVAADLIAQAEHDPGSAVLVTPSRKLIDAVESNIESLLGELDRGDAARSSLDRYGALILTTHLDEACDIANRLATEHLQIMTRDDDACLARIRHAGAIFVGPHTPVPLGDYWAGPSHVLPTGGTAMFSGPLSCNDFLKASSLLEYDEAAVRADGASVADFASREGLTAHAAAVTIRTHDRTRG